MPDLLSQLRDIRGLDAISWWPLAPGWWGVAALVPALIAGLYLYRRQRLKKAASWQAVRKKRRPCPNCCGGWRSASMAGVPARDWKARHGWHG